IAVHAVSVDSVSLTPANRRKYRRSQHPTRATIRQPRPSRRTPALDRRGAGTSCPSRLGARPTGRWKGPGTLLLRSQRGARRRRGRFSSPAGRLFLKDGRKRSSSPTEHAKALALTLRATPERAGRPGPPAGRPLFFRGRLFPGRPISSTRRDIRQLWVYAE